MTTRKPIRVVLADDHPLVVEGITACLQMVPHIELVGVASDGYEALQ